MAFKRKNSPFWWVSLTDQSGKRVKRSTGTTDRKEAEALEAKWKVELYRAQVWDEPPEVSFEEVMLYYMKNNSVSANTANDDRGRIKRLSRSLNGVMMDQLTARQVISFRQNRLEDGVSPSTVNREMALLSAAINLYNRDMERNLPNPVIGRKLKTGEGRTRWITKAESATLIAAARQNLQAPHLPDFIILALNTGMRKQEMLGLEWRRVDFQQGLIYLEGMHTKTARRRTIPLNQNAKSALLSRMRFRSKYCPDSSWVFTNKEGERINNVKKSFSNACRKAGIEDFRIHDMRHTCAAWLVTSGKDLQVVRDLLGHTTIAMTERYAHLSPENVRQAVAVLDDEKPKEFVAQSHFSPIRN